MRVLGEIPAPGPTPLRPGTLRRCDQTALGGVLAALDGAKAVLVTGDRRRKRALAVGLAAAAAASGTRTALLEGDLGDPTLAEALGLAIAPGLREYMRGEAEAGSILKPLALAGPGSAAARGPLVCVVAGRPSGDGAAPHASDGFRQAIAGLRDANELVLVEGPPLPGADGPLAAMAATVDATLVCVGGADEVPALPVPVAGLVVQPDPPQRS